jgi:hypothetical protein
MKILRMIARGMLALSFLAALTAPWIAPRPYDRQYRQSAKTAFRACWSGRKYRCC